MEQFQLSQYQPSKVTLYKIKVILYKERTRATNHHKMPKLTPLQIIATKNAWRKSDICRYYGINRIQLGYIIASANRSKIPFPPPISVIGFRPSWLRSAVMDWFSDPSKALLPPDPTYKPKPKPKPGYLIRYDELSRLVTSYEARVLALEQGLAGLRQQLDEQAAKPVLGESRDGGEAGTWQPGEAALLMNAHEAGMGVPTRAGVSAGGNTHSSVSMGFSDSSSVSMGLSDLSVSGDNLSSLDRLGVAGILRRCHSCGKVIPVMVERDGVGSRKRRWKRFCDKGCRLDWESRAGKRWGGVKQTGLQTRYRGVYRDGVYVLYRWLVGRGFVGTKVIRESGVLGSWYFEKGVGSDPRRFGRLVGIMVELGLLEARLVPVGGLQRREWCVIEPVVAELLESGSGV